MSGKSVFTIVALAVCLVFAQGLFASESGYPDYYRPFEVRSEEEAYSLSEVLWFNPTVYCIDVLQFIQAYLMPEDPVGFYRTAAEYTDEEIEDNFLIFQAFIEPDYAGYVNFDFSCDLEAYAAAIGYSFDPEQRYSFGIYFEDIDCIPEIFPRGVGRTNSYDTFRRTAVQLALYAAKNGKTPGFDVCYDYIQQVFAFYEAQFDEAMAAESAATGTSY